VIIPHDVGRAVGWIKFRSGTRGNPVEQREGRLFAVAVIDAPEEAPPARSGAKRTAKKKAAKKKARR